MGYFHCQSYFDSLRASQPIKHGSVVDGKRVTATWFEGSDFVYQLEGETEPRRIEGKPNDEEAAK